MFHTKLYYNDLPFFLKGDSKSMLIKLLIVFLTTLIVFTIKARPLSNYDIPEATIEVPFHSFLDESVRPNIQRSKERAKRLPPHRIPLEIAHYLWKNFAVESDQRQFGVHEYWQTSEEFQENKRGDCEDFSIYARELLKQNGYQAFLFNIYGASGGHTVVIFKEGTLYKVLDGDRVLAISAKDFRDLPKQINPFWRSAAIVTYGASPEAGRILKVFYPR